MPKYFINEDGDLIFRSKYSHEGAFRIEDIFGKNYKTGILVQMKKGSSWKDYGIHAKYMIAHMVFYDFMIELFLRLTDGGMFMFPGKSEANIALKTYDSKVIDRFMDLGIITKRDLDLTGGKWPYFEFHYGPRFRRRAKHIKTPKWIRDLAIKKAKIGQISWHYNIKNR
jgi:hypothetical protein